MNYGAPQFYVYLKSGNHLPCSGVQDTESVQVPFSEIPALKAHYTEKVALLYHNLSNCFHITLNFKLEGALFCHIFF